MFKYIIARLRWGSLSPEKIEKLNTMTFSQVFTSPYLIRKYYG